MTLRDDIWGAIERARFSGGDAADEVHAMLRGRGLDALPVESHFRHAEGDEGDPHISWCEWPVNSGFRRSDTCGRSGASRSKYGLHLCWQHEDSMYAEVAQRVRSGQAHDKFLSALVEFIVTQNETNLLKPQHAGWSDAIDHEIERRIEEYVSGVPCNGMGRRRVNELIDHLIEQRLNKKWGAA